MSERYKFIEHTADVEFIAYGKTIEELFENALAALFDTMADIKKIEKSKSRTETFRINEMARTLDDLLWFVLQDALSISDAEGLYGYGVKKLNMLSSGDYVIDLVANARKKEQKLSKLDVKGVSKFDLKIVKTRGGFEASVVLDV